MSNRQARNRSKARRRRDRTLAAFRALPVPEGWTLVVEAYDYGTKLGFAVCDVWGGVRIGWRVRTDRLWRRMDTPLLLGLAARLIERATERA